MHHPGLAFCLLSSSLLLFGCSSGSGWPFREGRTTIVVTQRSVIEQHRPVLAVVRNANDGQWMFFADENPAVDIVVTLTLEEMMGIDSTLTGIAGMQSGWKALRTGVGQPWTLSKLK